MPTLRAHGKKGRRSSADYRLKDPALYTTWYKAPHEDAGGLAEAVYGLPELHRKQVTGASLVASPGCYPMGAILATAPLLKSGRGSVEGIVIDGKSGVTGAGAQGRKAEAMYLFTEANENVQAYGMATHRHTPEIEQELSALAGRPVVVAFTPHLVPLNRGLFTTASVPLTKPATTAELVALYQEFYAGERRWGNSRGTSVHHPIRRGLDFSARHPSSHLNTAHRSARPAVRAQDNLGKAARQRGIQTLTS